MVTSTSAQPQPATEYELPALKEAAVSDQEKKDLDEKPLQDLKAVSGDELAALESAWGHNGPPTTSSHPTTSTSSPPTSTTSATSTTSTTRPPHCDDHCGGHRPPVWQHPDYDPYGHPLFYNPRFDVSISVFVRDLSGVAVGVVVIPPRSFAPVNVCGNGNYGFAVGVQTPNVGVQVVGGGTFNGYGCHPQGGWRPPPPPPLLFVSVYVEQRITRVPAYFYRDRVEYWSGCGCDREYGYVYLRDNSEQLYGYRYTQPQTRTVVFVPEWHRDNAVAGPVVQGPPAWSWPNGGLDPKEAPQQITPASAPTSMRDTLLHAGISLLVGATAIGLIITVVVARRRRSSQ